MCGLVGLFSKKGRPVGQQVFSLYKSQHTRGKEGFGYLAISDDWKLLAVNRAKTESGIKELIMKDKAPIILFHHRMPTSTKNTIGTTHPIFVSSKELEYDYFFAHNGVITNKDMLKKKHEALGYIYTTEFAELLTAKYNDGTVEALGSTAAVFNDSESLAIELARYIEELSDKVEIFGAAAFWGVALDKGTNQIRHIYYGKNQGRDLKVTRNKKYHGISSETGHDIESMKLYSYDLGDPQLYEQDLSIGVWTAPSKRTIGYGADREPSGDYRVPYQYALPPGEDDDDKTASMFSSIAAYDKLENKHYLYSEALATEIPLSEFMAMKTYTFVTYVPVKFMNETYNRKQPSSGKQCLNTDVEEEEDKLDIPVKTRNLLEDLCTQYAKIETARDKLEESYTTGMMSESEYDRADRKLEGHLQEIEEKISTLNVPESLSEEILDLSRQMEDYNRSYNVQNEDIEYIQIS